ncbi:S-layer homology domain-containing protein, partial [Intestinimonas butyriciproducens]
MKTNRLLSCALALAVTVSALALPASAATAFPDIQSHWAKSYIEEMTDANMFKGYEDGTFKPENKLTTAEALALCARAVGLDENTSAEIADDYKEAVDDVLDGSQSWFYREFAICLAAGILTESDLKSLTQSGALTKPIVKEDLAVYLIRAMQLGPMSERLSSYPMSFDDTASISESA